MKKKILITIILLLLAIGVIVILLINNSNKQKKYSLGTDFAYFVYDEAKEKYVKSKNIPTGDYRVNKQNTYCEANGKITGYNNANGSLTYKLTSADKCYVYFDVGILYTFDILNSNGEVLCSFNYRDDMMWYELIRDSELNTCSIFIDNCGLPCFDSICIDSFESNDISSDQNKIFQINASLIICKPIK